MKNPLDKLADLIGGDKALGRISRFSDLFLAILVVMIISLMIVPVNPHIIDIFIASNLTFSICLLMVALYIPTAVHLSIFPLYY